MAKQGMKRPENTHDSGRNSLPPVPELQGRAKHGKERANPLRSELNRVRPIQPSLGPVLPFSPIPSAPSLYPVIDTDLGRDNVENDLTAADLQDL